MKFEKFMENPQEKVCFEMSNIKKVKSGLPVNIWIDDAGSVRNDTMRHNEICLKFQNDTDSHLNTSILIPVKIDKYNPCILLKDGEYKLGIKQKQLNEIFDFIKNGIMN